MADYKPTPEDIARFLYYISQNESSGGKNINHKTETSGLHAGDTAMGAYGLMPKTREDAIKAHPNRLSENSSNDDVAKALAGDILQKAGGDETLAAGMWRKGQYVPKEQWEDLKNSGYTQAYEKNRKSLPAALDTNPYLQEKEKNVVDMDKALQPETDQFPLLTRLIKP